MSQEQLAVVILAAGRGTRMKSNKPKVLHELAGRPMINWLLDSVEALNPAQIIVVVGPDMPELEEAVAPHSIAIQPVANGTGGAVQAALPHLQGFEGDVLILLGDTPLVKPATLRDLVEICSGDMLTGLSVLGVELQNPAGYGRLICDKNGVLLRIVEDKDATPEEKLCRVCNTGAFCVDGKRLSRWLRKISNVNTQKEYYITDLVDIAVKDGSNVHLSITYDSMEVQGCNARTDLSNLEKAAQMRLRIKAMDNGATLFDPESVYLYHDTKIGEDTVIGPNVFFGPGVEIGKNVEIKAFCHLEGTTIKSGASIGPFARLRPGARIGESARIGNFVEVKQSDIGARSKINHLAYVGDCDMGSDTNFSAGAITVNYDGFQKHRTVIGKGVMIGSNVNLVAPVEIDDGAFLAAGSTITDNVPADALSVGRSNTEIREGWASTYRKKMESAKDKKDKKPKDKKAG